MKVKISAPKIKLRTGTQKIKPIAESLEITPSKDAQSFNGLYDNVNVSGDNNLRAENIKKDVSIFGVEGSYEPEIKLQNKSTSITENGTQTIHADNGYDGLQEVDITVNVEGEPNMIYNQEGYANYSGFIAHIEELKKIDLSGFYSLTSLFENWRSLQSVEIISMPSSADMTSCFASCQSLETAPNIDTSNVTRLHTTFRGCTNLKNVPVYNTSKFDAFGLYNTFENCPALSDTALNNIMQMCISATKISAVWKTLKKVGLTQAQAETCMTLSNYQAFLDAGWTTGY